MEGLLGEGPAVEVVPHMEMHRKEFGQALPEGQAHKGWEVVVGLLEGERYLVVAVVG